MGSVDWIFFEQKGPSSWTHKDPAAHDVRITHNPSRGHIMADELTQELQSAAAQKQILLNGDSHLPKEDTDPVDETGKKKKKKKKKGKAGAVGNKDGRKCGVALTFTAQSDKLTRARLIWYYGDIQLIATKSVLTELNV